MTPFGQTCVISGRVRAFTRGAGVAKVEINKQAQAKASGGVALSADHNESTCIW
jgi:hypothetical protein